MLDGADERNKSIEALLAALETAQFAHLERQYHNLSKGYFRMLKRMENARRLIHSLPEYDEPGFWDGPLGTVLDALNTDRGGNE